MKIVFFGTPKEVVPILEQLAKDFEVVGVVTAPDQKSGRKQQLSPSPVKAVAEKQLIPVLTPQKFTDEIQEQLQNYHPDLMVVAAYGKIIPQEILEIPEKGALNIHPSLLPKYRGPTPIQTTLFNGDAQSGISFMKMDKQMDHGPILHQIPFTLEKTDTFDWLMKSKFAQAAVILPQVINDYLSGKLTPQPQDDQKATYTQMITKEDGYIDLTNPPEKNKLDRMIRAYYPWPTVWTKVALKGREVRIKFLPRQQLQVEGKNPMSIKDFLNGYPEMKTAIEKVLL